MRSPRTALALSALLAALLLGACSSDDSSASGDGDGATTAVEQEAGGDASGGDVTDALEGQTPTDTVEVPPADGATTIADYSQGSSGYESPAPEELAQILALIGTDADGYLTDDAVVVQASEADATLWCQTAQSFGFETYALIPVLPDGTGVDCG